MKRQEFILEAAWKSLSLFCTHFVYVTRQFQLREHLLICLESGFFFFKCLQETAQYDKFGSVLLISKGIVAAIFTRCLRGALEM